MLQQPSWLHHRVVLEYLNLLISDKVFPINVDSFFPLANTVVPSKVTASTIIES